jgi:catechol-2,3-dioxygenase
LIEAEAYEKAKELLAANNIQVEKEIAWGKKNDIKSKSIYFRDPAGNLVEFITRNHWRVTD